MRKLTLMYGNTRNGKIALARIKRLASSGLQLEPLVRVVLNLVNDAIPSNPNRIFHIGGQSTDSYICNSLELNRVVPLHRRYYVESRPEDAGAKYRVNPGMLLKLFPLKTIWMHEEITLPNLYRTDGYNEVFKPWGFRHCLMVIFQEGGEYLGSYPIWRGIDQRPFSPEDVKFIRAIVPHISHGLKAARLLAPGGGVDSASFCSVPGWGSGVILLDHSGNPIAMDSSARLTFQQLAAMDGVNASAFDSGPVRDGLDYVVRTLRTIFHEPDGSSSMSGAPVYRLYSHWTGIVLNLRGVQMTGFFEEREYYTVLVERGETQESRRRRMIYRWGLSARETEVLWLVAQGKTGPEIAILLNISHNTARKHMGRIFEKLGVENRTAAAAVVLEPQNVDLI
jgi:DNA-binding CsgD family transcriptional regulator